MEQIVIRNNERNEFQELRKNNALTSILFVSFCICIVRVFIHSTAKIKRRTTNVKEVTMTKNFEAYYNLDKTGLENKYVILVDGEVVSKGEDIETMLREVLQKYPDEIPFVAKVPDKKMII